MFKFKFYNSTMIFGFFNSIIYFVFNVFDKK